MTIHLIKDCTPPFICLTSHPSHNWRGSPPSVYYCKEPLAAEVNDSGYNPRHLCESDDPDFDRFVMDFSSSLTDL